MPHVHRGLNKQEKAQGEDNYTMMQGFEWYEPAGGKYYKTMKERAESLGSMGITAVWLPHDRWDLGEFDQKGGVATKYGTKEELLDLIQTLKANGVVSYVDCVLNHQAGADYTETFKATEVAEENRNQEVSEMYDIDGWTGFNFPGRKGKYSEMVWNFNHFDGLFILGEVPTKADMASIRQTGVDWDDKNKKKAIFKIHGEGKTWAKAVDKEKGSFDYLMFADIDHSHPEARDDCINWGEWVLKETGADGFRFDAIKHIDESFIADFVQQVRERVGNTSGPSDADLVPSCSCVGEFWKDSIDALGGYLDRMPTQFSIFDTPLHYNFKAASDQAENYDIRKIFDDALVQSRPMDAVTLVENHDTQHSSLPSERGSSLSPTPSSCYAPMATRDLYGCNSDPKVEPMNQLGDFVRARKLFAYGPLREYNDHANTWGWVREGDEGHDGCAVEGEKRMQLPDGHAGEVWTDVLGWQQGEVTIEEDGWATFKCPTKSAAIWTRSDARGREEFGKNE
ncbi:SPOSA6832_03728 [Sporobolomyces salmonicolor]|uniref:SPOSA6832_03728-mRNA-1:cds n=1 Tax=Sporidiobolus salmonicolor TaxID=5005 RepID=A0A0D6EQX1_SPOSA|nr:SPOSA6832_03728 [Sporobolomyces salmonicolor]